MVIKTYEIAELQAQYGGTTTLDELRDAVLAEQSRDKLCPQCSGTGLVTIDAEEVECPTCEGYGYTAIEYIEECEVKRYVPNPTP